MFSSFLSGLSSSSSSSSYGLLDGTVVDTAANRALAKEAADQSLVLLKNLKNLKNPKHIKNLQKLKNRKNQLDNDANDDADGEACALPLDASGARELAVAILGPQANATDNMQVGRGGH